MKQKWFVIVNPVSGNGAAKKKWPLIYKELQVQKISFEYVITEHKNHALDLIKEAVKKANIEKKNELIRANIAKRMKNAKKAKSGVKGTEEEETEYGSDGQ